MMVSQLPIHILHSRLSSLVNQNELSFNQKEDVISTFHSKSINLTLIDYITRIVNT